MQVPFRPCSVFSCGTQIYRTRLLAIVTGCQMPDPNPSDSTAAAASRSFQDSLLRRRF